MKTLQELREQIDQVDQRLLELLNERAKWAHEVGELKKTQGAPIYRPEREAQVIHYLQSQNQGPLTDFNIGHIWREIMSACRSLETPQRVAFLGPVGTFSQQAALNFFGSSITEVPCSSIDEVFHAASSGGADFGVIPLENSTEGVVTRSLDLMLAHPTHLIGEISLLIRHHLLCQQDDLKAIETVAAHPQALAQCQGWLSEHLPHAQRQAVASNAQGALLASQDPRCAAIASERAANEFGLHIVAHAIQDEAHNRTRFGIICLPSQLEAPTASGRDCTSLVVSVPNQPGAVHDLLLPLKQHGVSMTRLESRPARSAQWEYYFYIDLQGHPSEPHVALALKDLQKLCGFYKILGTYPAADA